MKKRGLFFSAILLCLAVIAAIAFYMYQKPRDNLNNIKPDYTLSAKDLYTAFQQDEKKAGQQFLDKVIQVTGTVDNVEGTDSTITLLLAGDEMGGINCSVRKIEGNKEMVPAKGAIIKVKGKCIGFLMDVNLVDAVIEE